MKHWMSYRFCWQALYLIVLANAYNKQTKSWINSWAHRESHWFCFCSPWHHKQNKMCFEQTACQRHSKDDKSNEIAIHWEILINCVKQVVKLLKHCQVGTAMMNEWNGLRSIHFISTFESNQKRVLIYLHSHDCSGCASSFKWIQRIFFEYGNCLVCLLALRIIHDLWIVESIVFVLLFACIESCSSKEMINVSKMQCILFTIN